MKRLLFAPLLISLLVASCSTKKKYNSYREANDACKEWADKGGYYTKIFREKTEKKYDLSKDQNFLKDKNIESPKGIAK